MLKIVCISDTHGQHHQLQVPDGDILIHAGDFTFHGRALWRVERQGFFEWWARLPHRHKILIAGNNEEFLDGREEEESRRWLESRPSFRPLSQLKSQASGEDAPEGSYYLQNESIQVQGLKIHGAPQQPFFGGDGFNVESERKRAELWEKIPKDTQVLITHAPPLGICDAYKDSFGELQKGGCAALRRRLTQLSQLRLHVFGHLHRGYGHENVPALPNVLFVNAAMAGSDHRLANQPLVVETAGEEKKLWQLVK